MRDKLLKLIKEKLDSIDKVYEYAFDIEKYFSKSELNEIEDYFDGFDKAVRRAGFYKQRYYKYSEGFIIRKNNLVKFDFKFGCKNCNRYWYNDIGKCNKCGKKLEKIDLTKEEIDSYMRYYKNQVLKEIEWNKKLDSMSSDEEEAFWQKKKDYKEDKEEFARTEFRNLPYFGPKKYNLFLKEGIDSISKLIDADSNELSEKTGMSIKSIEKLKKSAEAISMNKVIQIKPFKMPSDVIYFDIETDEAQSYIWMVGVYYQTKFYPFYADTPEDEEKTLLEFLELIKKYPKLMLCYFSPKGFDKRIILERMKHYDLNSNDFAKREFLELALEIKSRYHLPTRYSLKEIGTSLGYKFDDPEMNGLRAAFMYEDDPIRNKKKLIDYSRDDVKSMAFVLEKMNQDQIDNLEKQFDDNENQFSGPITSGKIIEFRENGMKLQEIADLTGRSLTYVYNTINNGKPKGNKKTRKSKIEGDELVIKDLKKLNYSLKDISSLINRSIYYVNSRLDDNYKPSYLNNSKFKPLKINISWLNSLGFCEKWVDLKYVQGLELPITKEMQEGSVIHLEKEEEFLKEAVPASTGEILSSEEKIVSREFPVNVQFGDMIICGIIDQLEVDKDSICIVDDKPHAKLYSGIKNQLLAYSFILKKYIEKDFPYLLNKPLYVILRDRDAGKNVWKQKIINFNTEALKSIMRLREILNETEKAKPTDNVKKCQKCAFNNVCEDSLVKVTHD
ncbi:MAG: ribonuclease H-like domain-containing protein [Nanoarchaeota archaeon]